MAASDETAAAAAAAARASEAPAPAPAGGAAADATDAGASGAGEEAGAEAGIGGGGDGSFEYLELEVPVVTPEGSTVTLYAVAVDDTGQALKQLLADSPDVAHHTCYHLEAVPADGSGGRVLHDYAEFRTIVEVLTPGATLRMVPDLYTVTAARAHVRRVREILVRPPMPLLGVHVPIPREQQEEAHAAEAAAASGNAPAQPPAEGAVPDDVVAAAAKAAEAEPEPRDGADAADAELEEEQAAFRAAQAKAFLEMPQLEIPVGAALTEYFSDEPAAVQYPACLKSIAMSAWNPPPSYRRAAGDLLYLEATMLEGNTLNITATAQGFFINSTHMEHFAPGPSRNACFSQTLVGCLRQASASFDRAYTALMQTAARSAETVDANTVSNSDSAPGASPNFGGAFDRVTWVARSQTEALSSGGVRPTHTRDLNRAEDMIIGTRPVEEKGIPREWTDEYRMIAQSPTATLRDRILRFRALHKLHTSFVAEAIEGAKAVVHGAMTAMNPLDDPRGQVFVANNVFFSYAVDSRDNYKSAGGDIAAHAAAGHDLRNVRIINAYGANGLSTLLTVLVDYLGVRVVAQCVIPGIFSNESVSRVVYGSVDSGAHIEADASVHESMRDLCIRLHVAERVVTPLGPSENAEEPVNGLPPQTGNTDPVSLCGAVDSKIIIGNDKNAYLLDVVRITPPDANWLDAEDPYSDRHQVVLLRHELIRHHHEWRRINAVLERKMAALQAAEENKDQAGANEEKADADEEVDVEPIVYNVNVFTKIAKSQPDREADEQAVRELSAFLRQKVIPSLMEDVREERFVPMDGNSLVKEMHRRGVNVRYLGEMATLAAVDEVENFGNPYFLELLETEMVARAAKALFRKMLSNEVVRATPAVVCALLSAVLGAPSKADVKAAANAANGNAASAATSTAAKRRKHRKGKNSAGGARAPSAAPMGVLSMKDLEAATGMTFTHSAVWAQLEELVQSKFRYTLKLWANGGYEARTETAHPRLARAHRLPALRRICQMTGIRVAAQSYDFSVQNVFDMHHIVDLVPVVKHSMPERWHPEASRLHQAAQAKLSQGEVGPAYEWCSQAQVFLAQVTMHTNVECADMMTTQAAILYSLGERKAACATQARALSLYCKLLGPDDHTSIVARASLSTLLSGYGDLAGAVMQLRQTLYFMELATGPRFREIVHVYMKLAMIFQSLRQIPIAIRCFQEALSRCPQDAAKSASCCHALAVGYMATGAVQQSLYYEQQARQLYKQKFGEDDERTKESTLWVRRFAQRAVEEGKAQRALEEAASTAAAAAPAAEVTSRGNGASGKSKSKRKGK